MTIFLGILHNAEQIRQRYFFKLGSVRDVDISESDSNVRRKIQYLVVLGQCVVELFHSVIQKMLQNYFDIVIFFNVTVVA